MLANAVSRYVELHRAMGFKYLAQDRLLRSFAVFADAREDGSIRTQSVIDWAGQAPSGAQRRNRLLTVRRFALAMQAEDSRHECPPCDVFGHESHKRGIRHIYSCADLTKLLAAAARLEPAGSLRPATYVTLFALLAATGLRISEALALTIDDFTDDGLVIRATKFSKNRLVPLHETTALALSAYLARRSRIGDSDSTFFISADGHRLCYDTVMSVFLKLVRSIGLRDGPGKPGPRIHDLRHTFAVRSLEQCSGDQRSVARHVLALSTYLGHAHVADTYWYLQATPILTTQIAAAGEALFSGDQP
ncbi:tyrosine-type recombinase/integrase [Paraburkholderia kururiensis]|uniref:tyrosine-type recombinase/integrase n=1 Tax=Paraburkholderia kururiensis TaxID=984307 RepID=UPI0015922F85|nr:tyrosine-type recombinase/integrase [Paraburkholderia kururiensis]